MPDRKPKVAEASQRALSLQLVFFAAAILYLELAVIRFSSAEVLYLGYFSNFVLLSVFVGLGVGFLSAKKRSLDQAFSSYFPVLFIFLFALILCAHFDVDFLKDQGGLFFFGNVLGSSHLPGWILLPLLFVLVSGLFMLLGREVAMLFPAFPPIQAYMLDIVGSLGGILLFTVQNSYASGPLTWIPTGCFLLCLGFLFAPQQESLARRAAWRVALSAAAVCLLILASPRTGTVVWSPYQKLTFQPFSEMSGYPRIYANGILHQFIIPPEVARQDWYDVPYKMHSEAGGSLDDVLIIGAGSGTDLSVALLNREVKSVDAVDIDPGIVDLGREHNPAAPYQDPRVQVHVIDGRAFLRQTAKKYDVIVFALPDSLMRLSSLSNVRLESYLFTLESFEEVRRLLKPSGSFFLYNQYRWEWLKVRVAAMLEQVFGKAPFQAEVQGTTVFGAGSNLSSTTYPKEFHTEVATDDWPHVYMQQRQVSWYYLCMIGMFLAAALAGVYWVAPAGTLRNPDFPFFFMGAAFLLLEARSISVFSLLFGATWLVNSLVFAGILLSVLLANLVVMRFRIQHRGVLFACLIVSILAAYACPPAMLLDLPNTALRYLLSIALYFSPIFVANLIFSREFRDFNDSQTAFGWNLLGAVFGGGIEYFGLAVGNRNLLWIALTCYLLTWYGLYGRNQQVASGAATR